MTHSTPPRRGSHTNEAFRGVKATSDTALKTGDMGLPEHRQLSDSSEPAKYDSNTISSTDRQRRQETVYFINKR